MMKKTYQTPLTTRYEVQLEGGCLGATSTRMESSVTVQSYNNEVGGFDNPYDPFNDNEIQF